MAYPDSRHDRSHYLACFDLRTGRHCWWQPLSRTLDEQWVAIQEKATVKNECGEDVPLCLPC